MSWACCLLPWVPTTRAWLIISERTPGTISLRSQLCGINRIPWWVWFIILQKGGGGREWHKTHPELDAWGLMKVNCNLYSGSWWLQAVHVLFGCSATQISREQSIFEFFLIILPLRKKIVGEGQLCIWPYSNDHIIYTSSMNYFIKYKLISERGRVFIWETKFHWGYDIWLPIGRRWL